MSNVYLASYNTARANAYGRYCAAALENNSLSKSDICKKTGLRKSMIDDIEKSYNLSNPKSKTTTNYRRKLSNEDRIDRSLKSAKTRAINLQLSVLLKEINKGVNVLRNTEEINNLRAGLHKENLMKKSGGVKTTNVKAETKLDKQMSDYLTSGENRRTSSYAVPRTTPEQDEFIGKTLSNIGKRD